MSEKKPADDRVSSVAPFGLRMLPELRDRIAKAASVNGRSLNAEITARLEASFDTTAGRVMTAAEAEAYVEQARLAFSETFRSALEKSAAKMGQILLDEPDMLLNGLPLFEKAELRPKVSLPAPKRSVLKRR